MQGFDIEQKTNKQSSPHSQHPSPTGCHANQMLIVQNKQLVHFQRVGDKTLYPKNVVPECKFPNSLTIPRWYRPSKCI